MLTLNGSRLIAINLNFLLAFYNVLWQSPYHSDLGMAAQRLMDTGALYGGLA